MRNRVRLPNSSAAKAAWPANIPTDAITNPTTMTVKTIVGFFESISAYPMNGNTISMAHRVR